MDKIIGIPTSTSTYYIQYLTILNPIFGANRLRNKEIELMAKLIETYFAMPDSVPHLIKCTSIFSSPSVKQTIQSIPLSRSNYDVLLKQLINKRFVISKDKVKTLREDILFKLQPDNNIIFKFKIKA